MTSEKKDLDQLDQIFERYLIEGEHIRRLTKQTLINYKEVYKTFRKIMPNINTVSDIQPETLSEFFTRLGTRVRKVGNQTKIGVKPSTTSTYYNKLMTFFRWLEDNGYVVREYLTKSIRRPKTPVYDDQRALTEHDVNKILSAIHINTIDHPFLNRRDLAIVYTLLYTGVRRGELMGIRVHDIDFDRKRIFINKDTSKSKESRYIPIHATLLFSLKDYIRELKHRNLSTVYLFVSSRSDNQLSREGLKHWVNRYKELSGVRFHLHRFRHTFACNLALKGANLASMMRLLGHTTPRMTERYLRSITTEDSRSYVDKLDF